MKIPSKMNNPLKAVMNKIKEMIVKTLTVRMGQLDKTETMMVQKIVEKQMRIAVGMSLMEIRASRLDKTNRLQTK